MSYKKLAEEHLQYPEFGQDSTFVLRKIHSILKSARDEMSDNLHLQRLEELVLDSVYCVKLEIDQIPSACVTSSPC